MSAASYSIGAQQKQLSEKIIRLHVIANSDSPEDQMLKLKVRDKIMNLFSNCSWSNKEESQIWLRNNLKMISDLSLNTLCDNGKPQKVKAQLCHEYFPVRKYDDFALPSGDYMSLKVIIGEGKGKNWWCVVYPSICMPAAGQNMISTAASAGFTENEILLISEDTKNVKFKFKLLEIFQSIQKYLQDT